MRLRTTGVSIAARSPGLICLYPHILGGPCRNCRDFAPENDLRFLRLDIVITPKPSPVHMLRPSQSNHIHLQGRMRRRPQYRNFCLRLIRNMVSSTHQL